MTGQRPGGTVAQVGDLLVEQRSGVRWLTLDRPARRNALTPELIAALREALARADSDAEARVVCLTGAGELSTVDLYELLDFHEETGRLATVSAVHPAGRFGEIELEDRLVALRDAEEPRL